MSGRRGSTGGGAQIVKALSRRHDASHTVYAPAVSSAVSPLVKASLDRAAFISGRLKLLSFLILLEMLLSPLMMAYTRMEAVYLCMCAYIRIAGLEDDLSRCDANNAAAPIDELLSSQATSKVTDNLIVLILVRVIFVYLRMQLLQCVFVYAR